MPVGIENSTTAFVFTLDYADASNWEICKAKGLIGVRQSPQGQATARSVREGDVLYVWRGGGQKPGAGLIARAIVTGPAYEPTVNEVPWPDPTTFTYVIPITLDEELAKPVPDRFPGNRMGERFKLQNTALQKGLMKVSDESQALLEACFSVRSTNDSVEPSPVATRRGWSTDQELIRAVERAAVDAVRNFLGDEGWREVRDCQLDGCGYDFIFLDHNGRERLVEVKGTTSDHPAFQLTRLEHQVVSTDQRARICVVTRALTAPRIHVLEWGDVRGLGLKPIAWQVGSVPDPPRGRS